MPTPSSTDIGRLRTAINDLIRILGNGRLTHFINSVDKLFNLYNEISTEIKTDSEKGEIISLLTSIENLLVSVVDRLPEPEISTIKAPQEYQKK